MFWLKNIDSANKSVKTVYYLCTSSENVTTGCNASNVIFIFTIGHSLIIIFFFSIGIIPVLPCGFFNFFIVSNDFYNYGKIFVPIRKQFQSTICKMILCKINFLSERYLHDSTHNSDWATKWRKMHHIIYIQW